MCYLSSALSPALLNLIPYFLLPPLHSFFGEVLRIGQPDYLPNETDVLRARQKTVGITETRFTMGQLS